MPHTLKELEKHVYECNITRTHHRSLHGKYGYNHILDVNLVEECLTLYKAKQSKIRILDIGCGDGYAISQLKEDLAKKGLADKFEVYGLGLNDYEPMFIPQKKFIKQGLFDLHMQNRKPYDLIVSVYAFHYMWHKLEGIEKINNKLLADGGKAIIHFPGYLAQYSESDKHLHQTEETGNENFRVFLKEWNEATNGHLSYKLNYYYSDDDDGTLFTKFGILKFNKDDRNNLSFRAKLRGFSMFEEGFIFEAINRGISYVSSYYQIFPFDSEPLAVDRNSPIHRIFTVAKEYQGKEYILNIATHQLDNPVIVVMYPAAKEDLAGAAIDYKAMAKQVYVTGLGAVVRCNGLYDPKVEFHDFNNQIVRFYIDFILEHAERICGHKNPDLYLMGYSSGGSAIASIASEYKQVKKLLLMAPSYDSDKQMLIDSLNKFKGEIAVIAGDRDQIVFPSQVAWFYYRAINAKKRRFVELECCEHSFVGQHNRDILYNSPLWAFGDYNEFPKEAEMPEDENYPNFIYE